VVTWSKWEEFQEYSAALTVFFAEFGKCIVCLIAYRWQSGNSFMQLLALIKKERKLWFLYLIPSGLYAVYNILAFYSLERTDPTTYFIFLQLRSLVSGVVYQALFKKKLSRSQWGSMALLTIGAITKEISFEDGLHINVFDALPFILIQTLCSCFASVYNEYLFKSKDVDFWIQNLFFYTNSIMINFMVFISTNDTAANNLGPILQTPVLLVILNMIVIGITTSMFLKHLNAILKNFAAALELLFLPIAGFFFFGYPINVQTVMSIILIWTSMYIYAKNPIQEEKTKAKDEHVTDKKPLLESA